LRYASRLAGRLNRNWYAVYVQTPAEEPAVVEANTQQLLSSTLTLAKQLGAVVFTYKGEDIVRTLLQFAKEYRVGHIVIGSPGQRSFWQKLRGQKAIVERLLHYADGMTVTVLDTRKLEFPESQTLVESKKETPALPSSETDAPSGLSRLLSPERIVIWDEPLTKEAALRELVDTIGENDRGNDSAKILDAVLERERQGSTFFNEGVAFPHARIAGLAASVVSLGLSRQGISDEPTDKPVELVFLILSPAQNPDEQIKILALASRAAQDRHFLQKLQACRTSEEVMEVIRGEEELV
jgi:two-component system sensor histidine kinase KdpD